MIELIAFLPLVALLLALAFGVYPGEEIIARLGRRADGAPRESPPLAPMPRSPRIGERLALLVASRPSRGPPRLAPTLN